VNTSFDKDFENTGVIKFYPYIGDQYTNSSPRILILGESHYFSEDKKGNEEEINKWNNCKDTTRDWWTTKECLVYKPYKNTIHMLTNTDINNEWIIDRLAFYNFFQKHVGFGPSGTDGKSLLENNYLEFIDNAQQAYFKLIEIIKPNFIIAWGRSYLYKNYVPQDGREFLNNDKTLYRYTKYMDTYIWHMKHPSYRFFSLSKTIDEFSEVCKRLKIDYPIKQVVSG